MNEPPAHSSAFDSTRWTMVRRSQGSSEQGRQALTDLCEIYWQPVFRFLRCEGRSEDEARELTQEFFARLLQRGRLGDASPLVGKFRCYLLGAVKHFLADERKAARRQKRGEGIVHRPLDSHGHSALQAADPATAFDDTYFDRQWAHALLERVLSQLETEFEHAGKGPQFHALKPWLIGKSETFEKQSSSAVLNLSPGALKVAVHRLRKRFRALVREEITHTVASDAEVDEELRYLVMVLANHPAPLGAGAGDHSDASERAVPPPPL